MAGYLVTQHAGGGVTTRPAGRQPQALDAAAASRPGSVSFVIQVTVDLDDRVERYLRAPYRPRPFDGGRLTPGELVEALSRCLDPSLDGVQAQDL
jgi:hypothetical protein